MKRLKYFLLFVFASIFLSSCLTTLFPIFTVNDVVFNPTLIGSWKYNEDDKIRFIEFKNIPSERKKELAEEINKVSDKGYLVTRTDSSGNLISQSFVFLAVIGKNYYLDFYPAELPSQKSILNIYKQHFIKAHNSYKIDFNDKDQFVMKRFDKSFIDKLISTNKINIRHQVVDDENIITAPTEDLQKFIIQYSDNPKAFASETICDRIIFY
jgi:hypothetical protein